MIDANYVPEELQRINLSDLELLHTFGIKLYVGILDKTITDIGWMTECIQTLPMTHPLNRIIFHVKSGLDHQPKVVKKCVTLDETLSTSGRQVALVFNLDPICGEKTASQRQFITSAFPLSTKLGLLSFG